MRAAAVGVICFLLGLVLALLLRAPAPLPPQVVMCPAPPECAACPSCGPPSTAGAMPTRPAPTARRPPPRGPVPATPLPDDHADPDAHRERLRAWFETQAPSLSSCLDEGEPRRRLLVQMTLAPDGTVKEAALLGASDVPPRAADCLRTRVLAMRAPVEILRGTETVVVHVSL